MAKRFLVLATIVLLSGALGYILTQQLGYDVAIASAASLALFIILFGLFASFDMGRLESQTAKVQSDAKAMIRTVKRTVAEQKEQLNNL